MEHQNIVKNNNIALKKIYYTLNITRYDNVNLISAKKLNNYFRVLIRLTSAYLIEANDYNLSLMEPTNFDLSIGSFWFNNIISSNQGLKMLDDIQSVSFNVIVKVIISVFMSRLFNFEALKNQLFIILNFYLFNWSSLLQLFYNKNVQI